MKIEKEFPKGIHIIGDVHGCYKTLIALVEKLRKKDEEIPIVFCGDLIDRGPKSKEVIDFAIDNNFLCVLGNHEDMMKKELKSPLLSISNWYLNNGGKETIKSYNSPEDDEKLNEHLDFISKLPYYIEFPNLKITTDKERHLVVSHSSIARYYDLRYTEDPFQIIWNRDIEHGTLPSKEPIYNVFGHTVKSEPVIEKQFADIDTGAVFKDYKSYGNLTSIHFPSLKITKQENIDG
jgi:serine/threonine protein phosphatase 1